MPTIKFKIILLVFFYLLVSSVPQAHASTDPQYATSSATATVPSSQATTEDTLPPTAPVLIRPTDGTTTGDNKTEFVWVQSSDPNGNTTTYTLYLNGVATYLGISGSGNSSGVGYSSHIDGDEIKLKPSTPLADGEYDWYVVATDNSQNSTHSTTWHFTIDTVAPLIYLTTVDNYLDLPYNSNDPSSFQGLTFDISGPKDVYLTVKSEAWATITTKFFDDSGSLIATVISPLSGTGLAYPYTHLMVGVYQVSISTYDKGGNTSTLPNFSLNITQSTLTISLPNIPGLPPEVVVPYTPYSLPSLPATIAKIESRLPLLYLYIGLLAVALLALLIFLWKRKYNIIFLNDQGLPYSNIKVYHSIPDTKTHYSPIWMSKQEPISYLLTSSDRGRLYIRHLGRYSTLTIKTDNRTYVLSLSAKRKLYNLVLA